MSCKAEKAKLNYKKKKSIKKLLTETEVEDLRSSFSAKFRMHNFFNSNTMKMKTIPGMTI